MSAFFLEIVNMSISASWIVLAVLLLRILLKNAPKWITVLLWGIVAVRLICPFSIESVMSLMPSAETINTDIMVEHDIMVEYQPLIDTGVPIINDAVNPVIEETFAPEPEANTNPLQIIIPILSWVWMAGMVIMLAYTVISYLRVKSKIGTAVRLRENIYQSESVVSPFVLGVIKPRIYLPFKMNEQDMEHVIAHENAHIRRKDHLWKPFGFLLLTLHWFNPFIWIGYVLLCRDIELACDEKVVKELDNQQKADYAQALLTCSVNRRMIAACPLAFGEVGVKDRVKSVLNYKKPAFWIIIVAIIASIIAAVCFLTDPVSKEDTVDVNEDFMEGSLLYDLGATSIESIESCRLIDDGPVAEVYIGKEDFDIFAKYRYIEDFNPIDKIHEVLVWPANQRISIIINGTWFTLYLPEDGRIVVQVSGSFKVYQADENNRITHEKFEELVKKYNQIGTSEESETTEETNTSEKTNLSEKSELLIGILRNETKFIDEDGNEAYLKDYKLADDRRDVVRQEHTWVDFDSDGQSELVVYVMDGGTRSANNLVFHVENGQVFGFRSFERGMLYLKEDGTHVGSNSAGIYSICSLNFKNSTCEQVELAYYDDFENEFRINGKNATEKEVEAIYDDFYKKKDASWITTKNFITFRVNDSLPKYNATVTYNQENLQLAETLVISEKESGAQIQKFDLPENECFTKEPLYVVDITFDGNLDILVPSQRPASAVYFQAYIWNEKESQFIYAPTFENLSNIALDIENKLVLSKSSASMITSYGVSHYDTTKNDFTRGNSLYIEPTENDQEIRFVESELQNGEWKTVAETVIAGDDPYSPDKTDPAISHYYEKGSLWDLDSEKWDSYFLVDKNTSKVTTPDQLYTQFLNGEIAANDNGQEKFLKDYLNSYYSDDDGKYKYTFIDMTGDGIEELCIKNYELYFFTIENGTLCHWCTEGVIYTDLLNNGALFYERPGGAPIHTSYQYYELDEKGSVSFKITFEWYDGTTFEEGKVYSDRYWVNDKEVIKEAYEEKTKEYLARGNDKVTWYDGDVNVTIN